MPKGGVGSGLPGLLGKRKGAIKKHADNKFSWRALMFGVAAIAVPIIWFKMLNDFGAPKSRALPTVAIAAAQGVTPTGVLVLGAPMAMAAPTQISAASSTWTPSPSATMTPTLLPTETVTLTPSVTPTETPTFTPTFPAVLWLSIRPIWPDDRAAWCGGSWSVESGCAAGTASGADWRLLSGRALACPASFALGSMVVTEGGQDFICVDRSRGACADSICPVFLYVRQPERWAGARLVRAYTKGVGQ